MQLISLAQGRTGKRRGKYNSRVLQDEINGQGAKLGQGDHRQEESRREVPAQKREDALKARDEGEEAEVSPCWTVLANRVFGYRSYLHNAKCDFAIKHRLASTLSVETSAAS